MDGWQEILMSILGLSVGGVSLVTVLANVIYCVKAIKRARKEAKVAKDKVVVTKEYVEQAFKNAVLPKTIKLDVSSKIEQPIKEGMQKIEQVNKDQLERIHNENVLILKVLNQFTHVKKLSEEDQETIQDIVNEEVTEEIKWCGDFLWQNKKLKLRS